MEAQILLLLLSQVLVAVASVASIKSDIGWIKSVTMKLDERVTRIEQESHCIRDKRHCAN